MKNKIFNSNTGSYNGIKVRLLLFWTVPLVKKIGAALNSYIWRRRNKKKFMIYAKALKNNPKTPHILLD